MSYIVEVLCAKDKLQERKQEQQSCPSDEHLGFGPSPARYKQSSLDKSEQHMRRKKREGGAVPRSDDGWVRASRVEGENGNG